MINFRPMHPLIETNRDAIESLCRLHGVRRLEVFGSILRDDFNNGRSDVDVLVEFEPQAANSFSNFLDLKESLEAIFGRSVARSISSSCERFATNGAGITSRRASRPSMSQRDPGV